MFDQKEKVIMDIAYDQRMTGAPDQQQDREVKTGGLSSLLSWNNLVYTMPITNSVASARNLKLYPSDQQVYNDRDTIIFTVQSGAQFVDWSKSFLNFELKVQSTDPSFDTTAFVKEVCWGRYGSVFNLISSVVVTSRSGVELQRIENFSRYRSLKDWTNKDTTWFDNIGSTAGYKSYGTDVTKNTLGAIREGVLAYSIPASLLGGIFDTDQLMPSNIAAGLRIEIRLSSLYNALNWKTGNADNPVGLSFQISKAGLFLDTTLLNDAAMREIRSNSATNGLEFVYSQVYSQKELMNGSTTGNMVVSKAVSRALGAFGGLYEADRELLKIDNTLLQSLSSSDTSQYPKMTYQQWRLGSQYYPHQPITNFAAQYSNMLYCSEFSDNSKRPALSLTQHMQDFGVISATFEKSALLRYSGVSINNSRTLSAAVQYMSVTQTNELVVFLEYVSISKAFLNNIVVSV